MARKRVKTWQEDGAPAARRPAWRTAWRAVKTVFVLLVIAYVAVLVAGRTEGFRDLVRQRLQRELALPLRIDAASLTARLDLRLRGVSTEAAQRGNAPSIKLARAFIGWDWSQLLKQGRPGIRRLDLDRCEVVFARAEDGAWQPAALAPLSGLLGKWLELDLPSAGPSAGTTPGSGDAGGASAVPAAAPEMTAFRAAGFHLQLRGGQITWWADDGNVPLAAVEGVRLQATPLAAPGRRLTHYNLSVERAGSASGARVSDLRLEMLDAGDQQVILGLSGEHVPAPRPAR